MTRFGLRPGPTLGKIIEGLKEEQAAGEITDLDTAQAWVEERVNDLKKQVRK